LKRFTRIDSGLPQVAVVLSGRIRLNLSYGGVSLTLLRQGFGGQVGFEKEIIVIPYAAEIYGLDYKSLLTNNGYLLKKETSFREVTYEEWSKSY